MASPGFLTWRGLSARKSSFYVFWPLALRAFRGIWPAALMAANGLRLRIRHRIRPGSKLFFPPDLRCPRRIVSQCGRAHLPGGPAGSSPPYFRRFSTASTSILGQKWTAAVRLGSRLGLGLMGRLACHSGLRGLPPVAPRSEPASFEKNHGLAALLCVFSAGGFHRHGKLRNVPAQFPLHPFVHVCTRQHGSAVPAGNFPNRPGSDGWVSPTGQLPLFRNPISRF